MFYLSSLCRTLFCHCPIFFFFFFQAEDGIRDWSVTGVQTCALPISLFSITSALFDKNTGGRVPRSGLWTLGGSRRRLPVPETQPRDTRANIPSSPSASTALIIPTGSKGFNTLWVPFPSSPLPHLRPLLRSPPLCVSTFRINTYKSVSKQRTLTIFRINTCEKPRGRGVPLAGRRDDSITSQRQCGTGGDWSGRRRRAGAPGAGRRLSGLGKFSARSADVQLKTSPMQPRIQRLRQRALQPIGTKIIRQRRKVGIKFRKELFNVHVAQIRCGILLRGGEHKIDEFPERQGLAVVSAWQEATEGVGLTLHVQTHGAIALFEKFRRPPRTRLPHVQRAADDNGLAQVEKFFGEL